MYERCFAAVTFPNLVFAIVKHKRVFHCALEDVSFIAYEIHISRISRDSCRAHGNDKNVTCNLPMLAILVVHAMAHGVCHRPFHGRGFWAQPLAFPCGTKWHCDRFSSEYFDGPFSV